MSHIFSKSLFTIGILFLATLSRKAQAQTRLDLVGSWELQYTLGKQGIPCRLPSQKDTLILSADGTFQWHWGAESLLGEWRVEAGKLIQYNCRPVGYEGTVMDHSYPIIFKDSLLNLREAEGGDTPCFDLFYKKVGARL